MASRFAVLLPAAGRSSRFRDKEKKPFTHLDGRAVWLHAAEQFITRDQVMQCIIIIAPEDHEVFRRRFGHNVAFMNVHVAEGGAERFESIAKGLSLVKPEADFVAIHDAVRPCLTKAMIDAVFSRAEKSGAALLAVPVTDTVKQVDAQQRIEKTVSRRGLWLAQTPQVFRRDWLADAYARRSELGRDITDDAQLVEAAGHPVHVVEGSASNLKITTKADLFLAEAILKARPKPKASGPIHPFAEDEMWGGRGPAR
jgi:2-C-methyl-D-erythritol 4-phosphate cytidylyltransferase